MDEDPIEFLENITDERIMELLCSGFKRDTEIKVKGKADGHFEMVSTLIHIAARYSYVAAMKMLIRYGFDVNQLDSGQLLPLYYGVNAYSPQPMIYLLCNKSQMIDNIDLEEFENHDDVIKRIQILFSYCTNNTQLLRTLINSKNENIYSHVKKYDNEKDLFLQTPLIYWQERKINWASAFSDLESIRNLIKEKMDKIIDEKCYSKPIDELTNEVYRASKLIIQYKSQFRDFIDIAKSVQKSIERAMEILSNDDSINTYDEIGDMDTCPVIHSTIFAKNIGRTKDIIPIIESLKVSVSKNINEIPDFESILDQTSQSIKSLKPIFENEVVPIIKDASNTIERQRATLCLMQFSKSTLGIPNKLTQPDDFNSSVAKLRTSVGIFGWKLPMIDNQFQKLIQTFDELKEINEAISEHFTFSTSCPSCHKNAITRVCSNCHALLACNKCNLPLFCPKCRQTIRDPEELRKTSFFGVINS